MSLSSWLISQISPVSIGITVLLVCVAVTVARRKWSSSQGRVVYRSREVMTATELKFFQRMVEALPEAAIVPQMAMSALVDVPKRQNQSKHAFAYRAKFSQQRLDFVVLSRQSGAVVCIVELDDHTHDNRVQKRKDYQRNAILERAGHTVLRFDARNMPSVAKLRRQFNL